MVKGNYRKAVMQNIRDSKIIKVALYTRVSTEEQKENFSLGSQLELLRKHAIDNRYEIYDEYVDDGYSGTSIERPHFQRLLDDAKSGKFELILVYRIDRFFRNNKQLLIIVDELEKFGVGIKSTTEPFDTSYLGKFVLSLFGSIAQLERDTFMERSRLGKLRRAKEGYYSGSSPSKFGYDYNKKTKKLEINQKEASVVKLIFSLYNQPDSSLLKVTRKLRDLNYRTKEGKVWETDRVHAILRETIYTGRWYANRFSKNKLKPKDEWIEVNVPKIISEEVFKKAQELLQLRKTHSTRNAKYNYLLQGLVKCGDCGNTIAGTADKLIQKIKGRTYGPYFRLYYRCTHFVKNRFEKLVNCKLKYIQAKNLEDVVWNEIEKVLQKPELIKKAVKEKESFKEQNKKTLQHEFETIPRQLEGLRKEEERVLEAYRQNIISIEQLKEQMENVRQTRENLEKRKQEIKINLQTTDIKTEIKEAIDYVVKIKQGINKFSYGIKKKILRVFDTKITVNINGKVDILCTLPKIALSHGSGQEFLSCFDSPRPIY